MSKEESSKRKEEQRIIPVIRLDNLLTIHVIKHVSLSGRGELEDLRDLYFYKKSASNPERTR